MVEASWVWPIRMGLRDLGNIQDKGALGTQESLISQMGKLRSRLRHVPLHTRAVILIQKTEVTASFSLFIVSLPRTY